MPTKIRISILLLALVTAACHPGYHLSNRAYNRIQVDSAAAPADSSTARFLAPYRQGLEKTMNEVLVQSTVRLEKARPESALNNLLCDAMLQQTRQRLGQPVDCSHLNYGGVRSGLPQGPIRVGNIFEVMPFDNQITVLTLKGSMLKQLFEHYAGSEANEAALLVGGVRVTIQGKSITTIAFTNGKTFQPEQEYTIAVSDFVANGGGGAFFLKDAVRRQDLNLLLRDAFIDYFRQLGKSGQPITPVTDGRITIQ
ncbi:5'-nucleotidase C-terminal domain-containing protein [Larkinella soli]|uniref:5'-nucleotidase C-terminal domain-containing protein n=1 Tax=Larkinella soli TaxID=1770527 RepID=UPI001E403924|nr:5'-nucleotidase [Larkinella soli]